MRGTLARQDAVSVEEWRPVREPGGDLTKKWVKVRDDTCKVVATGVDIRSLAATAMEVVTHQLYFDHDPALTVNNRVRWPAQSKVFVFRGTEPVGVRPDGSCRMYQVSVRDETWVQVQSTSP